MALLAPLTIHWELTNACNLRCIHCYQQDDLQHAHRLPDSSLRRIAERIIEANPFEVTVTGGEPFLLPILPELLNRLAEGGIKTHVSCNGTMLTSETLSKLDPSALTIQISVDSVEGAIHDAIRGRAGALRQALNGARAAVAAGFTVSFSYCAMMGNVDAQQVEAIVELAGTIGVHRVCVGEVVPAYGDRHYAIPESQQAAIEAMQLLSSPVDNVELHIATFSPHWGPQSCSALRRDMAILYDGYAYPCPFARHPDGAVGNVLETSIASLWLNDRAARFRTRADTGVRACMESTESVKAPSPTVRVQIGRQL